MNFLAILVSTIVSMVVGSFWYSPSFFGKAWMKLSGINNKKIKESKKKGMAKSYILAFIGSLVSVYILSVLINLAGLEGFVGGMFIGFLGWVGFILTSHLGVVLWEGKPLSLYSINVGYYLVNFLLMGGILGAWM